MRELRRLGLAAVVAAAAAAPAFGQGGTTGGTGGTGGQGGTGGMGNQGSQLATQQAAPQIIAPSSTTATTNRAVSATNFLQGFYGNPYYQGTYTNNKNNIAPGGFGQQSFGTTTTGGRGGAGGAAGGQIGFAGGAAGGTTGQAVGVVSPGASAGGGRGGGGFGGAGGGTGSVNLTDPGGQIAPLARQIAYPAIIRFQPPVIAPTSLQTEVRGMVDRSNLLANPASVQVAMADAGTVVLRGTVRDQDEARTLEGMIRLTPGVRAIRNELTYPRP
jgi:hypothetical protein